MAKSHTGQGEPPWSTGYREPEGGPEDKRRVSAHFYPAGRLKVYPLESERLGFVYVFRDAKGLVKVGLATSCAFYRCAVVSSLVPKEHRPVRLVMANAMRLDLAYKVERYAQYLLEHKKVQLGTFTEWFRTTPSAASRCVRIATDAVMRAEYVFGRIFTWRKALKLAQAGDIWTEQDELDS